MSLLEQLVWGSVFLGGCLILETAMLIWCVLVLRNKAIRVENSRKWRVQLGILMMASLFIVVAHTVQVWLWAAALILFDSFPDWNTALYFAIATYTTLGYGDVILPPELRIFAAFGAVTGMLAFGISTAFLIAVMRPMFPATIYKGHPPQDAGPEPAAPHE